MKYLKYPFRKDFYQQTIFHPLFVCKSIYNIIRYPQFIIIDLKVEGLISLALGIELFTDVLSLSDHPSPNIIEVGAFKGKSTCYLSVAAKKVGKRVKSFELFSGLPEVNVELDPFQKGSYSSDIEEYNTNVKNHGCSEYVDLIVGDARETLPPVIKEGGFCFAFLDADIYDVTSNILSQLADYAKGGEILVIHDNYSPGIQKAINEFNVNTNNSVKNSEPTVDTTKLKIPYELDWGNLNRLA